MTAELREALTEAFDKESKADETPITETRIDASAGATEEHSNQDGSAGADDENVKDASCGGRICGNSFLLCVFLFECCFLFILHHRKTNISAAFQPGHF